MHKLRWLVEMSQLEYKAMPIGWARRTVGPVKHLHLSMTATLAKSIALTRVNTASIFQVPEHLR